MVKDISIEQCILDCSDLNRRGITVHQKFTCAHCGSRQTMVKPNTFSYSGQCEECGKLTDIKQCGFLAIGKPEALIEALGMAIVDDLKKTGKAK